MCALNIAITLLVISVIIVFWVDIDLAPTVLALSVPVFFIARQCDESVGLSELAKYRTLYKTNKLLLELEEPLIGLENIGRPGEFSEQQLLKVQRAMYRIKAAQAEIEKIVNSKISIVGGARSISKTSSPKTASLLKAIVKTGQTLTKNISIRDLAIKTIETLIPQLINSTDPTEKAAGECAKKLLAVLKDVQTVPLDRSQRMSGGSGNSNAILTRGGALKINRNNDILNTITNSWG